MAVYTELNKEEIEILLNNYSIGKLEKFKGISKGIMNTNYFIYTNKNKYILRILEGNRLVEEEEKELNFLSYLSENNIPCPQVIKTNNNENYIFVKDKMTSIFSFLNGTEVNEVNEDILYKTGSILSKMHNLSEGMKIKREEKIELNFLFSSLISKPKKLKEVLKEDHDKIIQKYEKVKEIDFSSLPNGIIHNDIFPDNVFTNGQDITGLIDFNDAMTGEFLYDIAIIINFWIHNNFKNYEINLIKAFLKGYEENRVLTEEEKKLLPYSLEKAALTFLFLRIKKFYYHDNDSSEREFKDFRDLLPMVFDDKNIEIWK